MTQGQSHGVCGIVRLWDGAERAYPAHHVHDLLLLGPAVAHHSLLHLKRRIFKDGDVGFIRSQEDHSPAVSHRNAGGYVGIEKKLLHRHAVRFKRCQKLAHIVVYLIEAAREAGVGRAGRLSIHGEIRVCVLLN